MLDRTEIEAARARIARHVRWTPSLRAGVAGHAVTLKLEFLQHTGSFKARGAFNRLLARDVPGAGVVAASGGNHGAAVAYAARERGVPASIFVPAPTPQTKLDRISGYGARLVRGGAAYAEALAASRTFAAESGAAEIHAYDDPDVVTGQGTVGLELAHDSPDATHVLVAVGGGGLIGGIAAWYRGSGVSVIGVEPKSCPTWWAARSAGRPVPVDVGGLAADSLGARQVGDLMFGIATAADVGSILVADDAIRGAQMWLWSELRVIAEPGGATALAALLSGAWVPPAGAKVALILCGANAPLDGFT